MLYSGECYNLKAMNSSNNNFQAAKISSQFNVRLSRLGPKQKVRAIVLLRMPIIESSTRQVSRTQRKALLENVRQAAESAFPFIDEILEQVGGKRLADSADALGSIPVETTAAGIRALAASEYVKAILEDQPISSLPTLKHA